MSGVGEIKTGFTKKRLDVEKKGMQERTILGVEKESLKRYGECLDGRQVQSDLNGINRDLVGMVLRVIRCWLVDSGEPALTNTQG
jgi:hypothetical protein